MDDSKPDLKDKLKEKMSETGISVHALEKQAGLKRSAVQNILHGRSKKPSADILYAITKVLGCTIDELLTQTPEVYRHEPKDVLDSPLAQGKPFDSKLYDKAVAVANALFSEKNITVSDQQALQYINEIYQYSTNTNENEIDEHFAEWLASKIAPSSS